MILLWGLTGDRPFDAVRTELARRRARFTVIDQRLVQHTRATLRTGTRTTGTLEAGAARVPLHHVTAVYWRTYDVRRLPELRPATDTTTSHTGKVRAAWELEDAILGWLELTDARVVNRPSAMASNNSKPYQSEILRSHGFHVPATLITTDPQAALAFWTDTSSVVYKSISGARSIVARLTESHLSRLEHIVSCPTQFQQYIPGRDHRVHVVGERVLACEVHSDADDYRYPLDADQSPRLRATTLPPQIAEQCVTVTHALGLHLSGIDLRRAPDGRWFCFEVNPSPAYTYYQAHTGQSIAEAIADLLAHTEATPPSV